MGKIKFTKVVGSGNDFVILDNRGDRAKHILRNFSGFARNMCERKVSIGADGVLVLENSEEADFRMRIFNPDGSEVTMCGNGARCSAFFAVENKWCSNDMKIETGAGILGADVKKHKVKLKMTVPEGILLDQKLDLDGKTIQGHFINTGVPHVVCLVSDIEDYPVKEMGAKIRYHETFQPSGVNVNFVSVIDKKKIKIRTYERGVEDETFACGTGAAASAIISHLVCGNESPVHVITRSGEELAIYFKMTDNKVLDVFLEGAAKIVYEGEITF